MNQKRERIFVYVKPVNEEAFNWDENIYTSVKEALQSILHNGGCYIATGTEVSVIDTNKEIDLPEDRQDEAELYFFVYDKDNGWIEKKNKERLLDIIKKLA